MHPHGDHDRLRPREFHAATSGWARLDTDTIFRELIASELRAGRLTRAGRRRIVAFAAQLGLTAVEAGRLVAECRDAALASDDPCERRYALRLVRETQEQPARLDLQGAGIIAALLSLEWVLLAWLL